MDTMWFEQRKQTLRRLGYLNLALALGLFISYIVWREAGDVVSIYNGHQSSLAQVQRFQDAITRAHLGFGFTLFFVVTGLASFSHRMHLRSEYNARILAADPQLNGEFIPSLK